MLILSLLTGLIVSTLGASIMWEHVFVQPDGPLVAFGMCVWAIGGVFIRSYLYYGSDQD